MPTTDTPTRFQRLLHWRERHVTDRQLIIVLSFCIGVLAAIAAFLLHQLIFLISHWLTGGFDTESINWLYLVFPMIGILLTMLFVRYIVKDNISHGITRILSAMSNKQGRLKRHNCWTSLVASALTIGFGGSVGAEAPIVLTGSAIGSNVGKLFRLDGRRLMLLVGCGATAAIAGIFKAPLAGLVFTVEVLMIDMTMSSLLPILVASVTATCTTYLLMGTDSLFSVQIADYKLIDCLPAGILLGILCGLVSLYFIRTMNVCERFFARLHNRPYLRWLIGGVVLSALILFFPSLYGEGYNSLNILMSDDSSAWNSLMHHSLFSGSEHLLLLYVGLVLLTKVFATSATNGGGGVGGTFAPSLFVGGFGGFLFARLWNVYAIGPTLSEKNFTLLGMAGVMAGIMHAPLTGIFLIAELTGGYRMLVPLMVVSICAYLTIIVFEPHSIYGIRLARQGKLLTHHTDASILLLMKIDDIIEQEEITVHPDTSLGDIVQSISRSDKNYIPVVDGGGHLQGEIDIVRLRKVLFRMELYHHFTASQLMTPPVARLLHTDPMQEVMDTFERTEALQLPVVDSDGILKGYITRTRLYTTYRQMVADYSTE